MLDAWSWANSGPLRPGSTMARMSMDDPKNEKVMMLSIQRRLP
jgi:hypothetical protein